MSCYHYSLHKHVFTATTFANTFCLYTVHVGLKHYVNGRYCTRDLQNKHHMYFMKYRTQVSSLHFTHTAVCTVLVLCCYQLVDFTVFELSRGHGEGAILCQLLGVVSPHLLSIVIPRQLRLRGTCDLHLEHYPLSLLDIGISSGNCSISGAV